MIYAIVSRKIHLIAKYIKHILNMVFKIIYFIFDRRMYGNSVWACGTIFHSPHIIFSKSEPVISNRYFHLLPNIHYLDVYIDNAIHLLIQS